MKSLHALASRHAGLPLTADDVLEFHAARLLLLLRYCGIRKQGTAEYRIDGLTKMAKLDFFVRYPSFFRRSLSEPPTASAVEDAIEAPMIRFHYGPWDERYYHVLGYLTGKRLLKASREGQTIVLTLTAEGTAVAEQMASKPAFTGLLDHMKAVAKAYKQKSGHALKTLIYNTFDKEVGQLPLGERIGT